MAAWPLAERRRKKRYRVEWSGSLDCSFTNHRESIPAKVAEVSLCGARLVMDRLLAGPYHIIVRDDHAKLILSLSVPEGAAVIPVEILWYNMDEETRLFSVGVSFQDMELASQAVLERAVNGLK
jgi:hypothetical protein